jgi:hypothetical protein
MTHPAWETLFLPLIVSFLQPESLKAHRLRLGLGLGLARVPAGFDDLLCHDFVVAPLLPLFVRVRMEKVAKLGISRAAISSGR